MSTTPLKEIRVTFPDDSDAKKFEAIKHELKLDQNAAVIRVLIRSYKLADVQESE